MNHFPSGVRSFPLRLSNKNTANVNLCCGLSGQAYASLNLYNITGNGNYLKQAKDYAKLILKKMYAHDMRNHSLYKRDIGVGVLLTEINEPKFAKMPLFE